MKSIEILARVLSAVGLLGYVVLGPDVLQLFGPDGLFNNRLVAAVSAGSPFSVWSWVSPSDPLANQIGFVIIGCGSLGYCWLFLRHHCMWAALAAYLPLLVFNNSFDLVSYGYYQFLQLGLAYILLSNVAATMYRKSDADQARRVVLGFFRAHIAMAYCLAGVSKAVGPHWWSGESMWRALNSSYGSDSVLISGTWLGSYPEVLKFLGIGVVLLECAYPLVFVRRLRVPIIAGAISMHVGIIVFQGLLLFGLTMIALNVFVLLSFREAEAPCSAREVFDEELVAGSEEGRPEFKVEVAA